MKVDILIVGAGLAGASLACALRGSRYRIALLEQRQACWPTGWDSRVYALSPANTAFLTHIGAWQHLDAARICAVERMRVYGDAGGELSFSAYESGLPALAWILESSLMARELWETARRQSNIEVLCPATPVGLEFGSTAASLTLDDGQRIETSLVVAADGVNSWVRERAGLAAQIQPYGELGVVANFRCERPHHGVAYQWFRADGVLAWLPLPGNLISMVWSTADEQAQALLALAPQALCERVAQAGGHRLGALTLETAAAGFPLRLMRVPQVVAPRVALIGDAAHAIHPLSGHGINLGFQDARILAERLRALPGFRDCGELALLQSYARARAEEVALVQGVTHGLNRLFKPQIAPIATLRNLGMSLTGRLPLARSLLARYAAGLV